MLMFKAIGRLQNRQFTWKLLDVKQSKQHCVAGTINNTFVNASYGVRQYSKGQENYEKSGGAGGKLIFALGALTLAGGVTLAYAKYDSDFRKTLTSYVPFVNPVLDTLDEYTPTAFYSKAKQQLDKLSKGEDAEKVVARENEPISKPKQPKVVELAPQSSQINLSKYDEMDEKITRVTRRAVQVYNNAVEALVNYNREIEPIMNQAVNEMKPEIWENIRNKTRHKNECIATAHKVADEATSDLNALKELISGKGFIGNDYIKISISNSISKMQEKIEEAKNRFESELKRGSVTERYWERVQAARENLCNELKILFPNVDISRKDLNIKEDELDLLLLYVHSNLLFYQKELAKIESFLQTKVNQAIEEAKRSGLEPLTVAQICVAVEQEKRRLTASFQQTALKLKKEGEQEMREQLKRQSQIFNDHLLEAVKVREIEIERELSKRFQELLEEEKCKLDAQLSIMAGRLKGLDEGIKVRNDADASSKQAQVLWATCQSLLRAVRAGYPGIPWKDQIRPLEPEIQAVLKAAAPNDELVSVVIDGIPTEAKERGVFPEDALRERFLKVENVARTVDLVSAEGSALPVHILSYLQSLILVKCPSPISRAELNDEKTNFGKLNTNEILQRARYWLDRGDFAQALKYMNLLKGAPRSVARQWMNETRILLETQQAANTLMAHAASSGLMYL
ncbi:unnamed protein product [Ceutorhynchus assimilis]|uniref:MICOS complex subunit MIC60 n=1 Tax=Ceutorhynchus assimilis TaxID=467358 RepID=A0A9P0DBK6_9CUCU|nr:unnamed protein product [Ceutorhynchus assimilis]